MTLAFVPNDGYTEPGYVAAVPNLCPEIRFEYRPTRQEEREAYAAAMRRHGNNSEIANRSSYKFLADKLVSWDLKDADGNQVPITGDIVGRLKSYVFDRLFLIVSGQQASDPDPLADDAGRRREAEVNRVAAEKGVPYADAAAEVDRKNS